MATTKAPKYGRRRVLAQCLWCGVDLVDGKDVSGYTGSGPDYMATDGDFGCGGSPDTSPEGTGSHTPNIITTQDGHTVRIPVGARGQIMEHNHKW